MIRKTHTVVQKPRGRQLNTMVTKVPFLVETTNFRDDNSKTVQLFTVILA